MRETSKSFILEIGSLRSALRELLEAAEVVAFDEALSLEAGDRYVAARDRANKLLEES